MSRRVRVLYFAWLRERIGLAEEDLDLPPGVGTVRQLIDHLVAAGPNYRAAFAQRRTVRAAVNLELVGPDAAVHPGDEIGFFPPLTGG